MRHKIFKIWEVAFDGKNKIRVIVCGLTLIALKMICRLKTARLYVCVFNTKIVIFMVLKWSDIKKRKKPR